MIKIENKIVTGWEAAIRGARNPMNSWSKSDSGFKDGYYVIGENDLDLLTRLSAAGNDHGKFMRMIHVQCDVTAPLFWWKECDQYKVGTTTNSTSTMHKIHSSPITLDDFSIENYDDLGDWKDAFSNVVEDCENLRLAYNLTGDKKYWRMLIELLPESYNQMRTWDTNYAVLKNIYYARKGHKLIEWEQMREFIETLPHADKLIIGR